MKHHLDYFFVHKKDKQQSFRFDLWSLNLHLSNLYISVLTTLIIIPGRNITWIVDLVQSPNTREMNMPNKKKPKRRVKQTQSKVQYEEEIRKSSSETQYSFFWVKKLNISDNKKLTKNKLGFRVQLEVMMMNGPTLWSWSLYQPAKGILVDLQMGQGKHPNINKSLSHNGTDITKYQLQLKVYMLLRKIPKPKKKACPCWQEKGDSWCYVPTWVWLKLATYNNLNGPQLQPNQSFMVMVSWTCHSFITFLFFS